MGFTYHDKLAILKALSLVEGSMGFDEEKVDKLKKKLKEETTKNDE